jgi:hypothetical protein
MVNRTQGRSLPARDNTQTHTGCTYAPNGVRNRVCRVVAVQERTHSGYKVYTSCKMFVCLRFVYFVKVSRVAQSVYCLATGWTTGRLRFDHRQRRKDFSSSLLVQTDTGAHPTCCAMGTGVPFPRAKARPERDADHSPPSSAQVVNE